jgi:hypothetical protein
MSMICWVLKLSPAQINTLRATPSLVGDLALMTQENQIRAQLDKSIKRMPPEEQNAFEARHRASIEAVPGAKEAQAQIAEAYARLAVLGSIEQALDLEKSWHILHYLFTGDIDDSSVPGSALLTGEPLGEDLGYGPARLHGVRETRDFGHFLENLDLARLQARMNVREMTRLGVYSMPMGLNSDTEHESELHAEVAFYFPTLRNYVAKASESGDGLLIWLS